MRRKIIFLPVFLVALLTFNFPVFANDLVVTYRNEICTATLNKTVYRCSVGKNGISANKQEGDKTTPVGVFPLREILYRADRVSKPELASAALPIRAIKRADGWCDDPENVDYNKMVNLTRFDPRISHEELYRTDDLYDLIIVVGYNDAPIIPNKGSAMFIHIARPNYEAGAGCVAFSRSDLLKIISQLEAKSNLIVQG